jgi:MarR family transcriptional regulator, 2-MHQ and catechol-resistance regulon repressor
VGTHHSGTESEVRALNAFIKLMRAAQSTGARLNAGLVEAGLTESQFSVLEALYHLGPLHPCDLGAKLLCSSGNMTLVLDNLERRGLVRRQRGRTDRRFITVHLTDAGRRLIAAIFPRHLAEIVRTLSVLDDDEQDELGRLCRKLGRQERDDP